MNNFLAGLAVVIGLFGVLIAGAYIEYYEHGRNIKVVDQYLVEAAGCKNLGPARDKTHPLYNYVDHAFACPDGALIVIVK
jgi:hypothetical protein